MGDETALDFQNIAFGYGADLLIDKLSLQVRAGRMTALCGPNGSGKSTLLKLACGLLRPSVGQIRIEGVQQGALSGKALARKLAMLPQTPSAPGELSVSELVMLGRFSHRRAFASPTGIDREKVADAIAKTDMNAFSETAIGNLSGGQCQRAWVAMALAQDAPILLLDEPTNHLDIAHAMEIMELLRDLVDRLATSVVIVMHDINLAALYADDVVLMKDGAVVASGGHDTVFTQDRVGEVFGIACKGIASGTQGRRAFLPLRKGS